MKKEKTIYDLKLHEKIDIIGNHIDIMRVPGGWIYTEIYEFNESMAMSKCFVPFNDEFNKQKPIELSKPNKEIKT